MKWLRKNGVLLLVFILAGTACVRYLSSFVKVSSNVNGREIPIYSVETADKKIALTFDLAWGNPDISRILKILEKHNVHTTFFMTGEWVDKHPGDVQQICKAGHDIGNHSDRHRNMTEMTNEEKDQEITRVHTKVKELTGLDMNLFRAPYGEYNDDVIAEAERKGYFTIQWDVDSLDWKDYGAKAIKKQVLENSALQNGSIVLLHADAKYTVDALDDLLTGLSEKGYELVPVSQLIYQKEYFMGVSGRQRQK